jgi:dolichol-phosphate mannosyltransferase
VDDFMRLSVVIPVHDEEGSVVELAREVQAVLAGSRPFEIIFVDDGSTDATAARLQTAKLVVPEIRLLRHSVRAGQSAAIHTGIRAARSDWIATLDGDGQNDPADLPMLLSMRHANPALKLIVGNRKATRRDTWLRRIASLIANAVRGRLLMDHAPDSACGLKLLHRATFLELPRFDHMHRFLPALFLNTGAAVSSVPVGHRPRIRGVSKYGLRDRLWAGIVDLLGVRWLMRRNPPPPNVLEH